MTDAEARALIDKYTKAFLAMDVDGWTSCYTDDIDYRDFATGFTGTGVEEIRGYWGSLADATSDLGAVIHRLVVAPEGFAYDWTLSGRLDKPFGPLPGTGQHFDIRGTTIGTFRDGLIATNYDYWNWAALLQAFGVTELS